jgi:sulfonate transport system ATP-binding protein
MNARITLNKVAKRFDEGAYVLHDVSVEVTPGEIISIIGPSGCGKSTLLRAVAGLDRDHEGSIRVGERLIHKPGPDVGFIFQEPRLFPWLTVAENVAFGIPQEKQDQTTEIIRNLLRQVQLPDAAHQYPRQLSGGMMQRVAIARALAGSPQALLLDEPFSALDAFTRIHLQELILSVWEEQQITMLMVTHDVDEALYLSNRIIVLTERPSTIDEIIRVETPRPRDRRDPELLELRGHLLEKLRLAGIRRTAKIMEPEYAI